MNKHHQRVEQMVETARKAELAGIHVTFNVILGLSRRNLSRPPANFSHHERYRAGILEM